MSTIRNITLITVALVAVLALSGCTREITTVLQEPVEPSSCFECHGDNDLSIIAITTQWENSVHASGNNTNRNSASCAKCHTGDGFIQFANGEDVTTANNPSVIHCFVCHAPHSEGNFGMRITEAQELVTGVSYDLGMGNTCAVCHQARKAFDTSFNGSSINSSYWGPHHGTQSDLLLASNGHEYDGYTYNETQWHRTDTADGCVDCHVRTGGQNWLVGGHSFNMSSEIPGAVGEDPTYEITTESCENCHIDYDQDDFDYRGVQTDVETLLEDLSTALTAAGLLSGGRPNNGFLVADPDSAGALWNFLLIEEDRSHGIHNPTYAKDLLQSSLDYLTGGAK